HRRFSREWGSDVCSSDLIAVPGGFGTLEELCEILTWRQLPLVTKPIGILNVNGFYDHLEKQLSHMVPEGFLEEEPKRLLIIENSSEERRVGKDSSKTSER